MFFTSAFAQPNALNFASPHPINAGLAAWWLVNPHGMAIGGGSTLYDLCGRNHAVLSGSAQWQDNGGTVTGSHGRRNSRGQLVLAGPASPSKAEAPDDSSLSGSGDHTIAAWIFSASSAGTQVFMAKRNSTNNYPYVFASGAAVRQVRLGIDAGSFQSVQSTGQYAGSVWQHICFTRSGTSIRFYINGSPDSSNPQTLAAGNTNTAPVQIGCQNAGSDLSHFIGAMDDIRFWNRALTDDEVSLVYRLDPLQLMNFNGRRELLHAPAAPAAGATSWWAWSQYSDYFAQV